jgi:hypothetical protein
MDEVSYNRMKDRGNEVIMEKKIHLQLHEKDEGQWMLMASR